ncbi:hypothetical protein SAMN05443550_101328 [Pedobacter hartonius]|uniref:Uncharacterized protein n=1 Tax=Pedobacter hartonius TaxID=425514 RepID=A0A1H3WNC7_9SPHI|nr:hypothetical protein SAMN05443550_101328 [Pedobacter hartonius]
MKLIKLLLCACVVNCTTLVYGQQKAERPNIVLFWQMTWVTVM